jgi:hypothetical protein
VGGQALGRLTATLLLLYLITVGVLIVLGRARLTPDVIFVIVSVVALLLGRGWAFLRDWMPFLLVFLAWEAMRGLVDDNAAMVHSDSIIAVERFISFGAMPPADLQRLLYHPGQISLLDASLSLVYAAHFVLPLAAGFALWLKDRTIYYRYVVAFMLVSLGQFVTAALYPVAPPRFAGQYGEDLGVVDIASVVSAQFGLRSVSWIYNNMSGNEVAAFPSLHAAYPVLAAIYLREHSRIAVWIAVLYCLVVMVRGRIPRAPLRYRRCCGGRLRTDRVARHRIRHALRYCQATYGMGPQHASV